MPSSPMCYLQQHMICVIMGISYMVRAQVYLTEEQARDIKIRAQRERRREADVIRDMLERGRLTSTGKRQETAGEAMLRLVAAGKRLKLTGPTDLSINHDDYLYGDDQ